MKTLILVKIAIIYFLTIGSVFAVEIEDELNAIKARLHELEQMLGKQQDMMMEQGKMIEKKDRQIEELVENARVRNDNNSAAGWADRIEISGVAEVEAGYNDPDTGDSSSDIVLATAEIGIAAQVNE